MKLFTQTSLDFSVQSQYCLYKLWAQVRIGYTVEDRVALRLARLSLYGERVMYLVCFSLLHHHEQHGDVTFVNVYNSESVRRSRR